MNLETYLTGTRKEMQEDMEQKITSLESAKNYKRAYSCYEVLECGIALGLLYGLDAIGLHALASLGAYSLVMADVAQRVLREVNVNHENIPLNIPKGTPKDKAEEMREKNRMENYKNFIKASTTPGLIGMCRMLKQYIGGKIR